MEPALSSENRDLGEPRSVELAVGGMHCVSCASLIEETLLDDLGVEGVAVDLDSGTTRVTYDPRRISLNDLCAAIVGLGYSATPLPPPPPDPAP